MLWAFGGSKSSIVGQDTTVAHCFALAWMLKRNDFEPEIHLFNLSYAGMQEPERYPVPAAVQRSAASLAVSFASLHLLLISTLDSCAKASSVKCKHIG